MPTPCFLLLPTQSTYRALRRYVYGEAYTCPDSPYGYGHDMQVQIEDGQISTGADGRTQEHPDDRVEVLKNDPRWPTQCTCGYAFTNEAPFQVFTQRWYVRADELDGRWVVHPGREERHAPPGAMWNAYWLKELTDTIARPDGRCLMLRLPDRRDWTIDRPATGGGHWTRTGEPPRLTVRPSILTEGYHGWLTDGVLSDDLDGRTYA